ncbi:MAG: branched-chain amino acid transaminase [Nitrospinota bacterium]|nr:branched-chain amino acid transaminase [Nitrospinota bacterium]
MPNGKYIWMDGKLVRWKDATVHIMTHTLHYGFGIFEGIRCYKAKNGPAIFRLKEHVSRLFDSAKIIGIEIPFTPKKVTDAIIKLVKVNKFKECYIRPIAYIGDDNRGLNYLGSAIHLAIAAWPWGTYLGKEGLNKGIRVKVSSFTRHHHNITMTKAKVCGAYINSIMAKTESVRDGYDEAIMLDVNGNVAEGSGENIFMVNNGIIKTPPLVSVLEGITRSSIIEVAEEKKIEVREEFFSRDMLYTADEIFFTGTAAEVTPIREIDNRPVGNGKPGQATKILQKAFFDAVLGKNKKYSKWLTYI